MRGITIGLLGVVVGLMTWTIDAGAPVPTPPPDVQTGSVGEHTDHLICPLAGFIRSQTRIALIASQTDRVDLWQVSDGAWASFRPEEPGDADGWIEPAPSGAGSLVAEIGAGWSAAGMVNIASGARSAWPCGHSSHMLTALGGATLEGDRLDLILYNPYVWDSSARVKIVSELGEDTPTGLQEVYVPAGKTVRTSVDEALTLRRLLGVEVESSPGRVALVLQQSTDGATAVAEGVSPQTEWWLPVPDLGQAETYLLLGSPSESSFSYRIDLLTESGPLYGWVEENFFPNRLAAVPLSDLPPGVTGVRVLGTVALVAGLRMESEEFLATGPGVAGTHRQWALPGAGAHQQSRAVAWLLNPTVAPVSVSVSVPGGEAPFYQSAIAPESVLAVELDHGEGQIDDLAGYLVEAEEEIAVIWTSQSQDGAASYSAAVPVNR